MFGSVSHGDLLIGIGFLASLHLHGLGWQTVLFTLGIALRAATGKAVASGAADEAADDAQVTAANARVADNNGPTGFGFTNSRGSLLHVRHALPDGEGGNEGGGIVAVALLLHGLGAHTNRKSYAALAANLATRGIAVVMYDMEGHGRSGGLQSYIPDAAKLVDDAALLLELITHAADDGGDEENIGLPAATRARLAQVPLFVIGQSMGGALALQLGLRLQQQQQQQQQADAASAAVRNYCGAVLCCPALVAALPPAPIFYFLSYVIAPLFRKTRMPAALDATTELSDIWVRQEDIAKVTADGGPGGLASGAPMRFGTATALLAMLSTIQDDIPRVNFPFLVLHDPSDKVCKFEGTEGLLQRAATEPQAERALQRMPGMRHDLITNCTDELAEHAGSWMLAHLASVSKKKL